MTEARKPTAAMLALLAWMVGQEAGDGAMVRMRDERDDWSGGSLVDYYRARWYAEQGITTPLLGWGFMAGSPKTHAWRRAGGTALKNLADYGLAEFVRWHYGVPQYRLTDAGREAGEAHRAAGDA